MRSRVMPGSSVTIERRVPVRRLKSVDLPTFGRPTITMDGSLAVILFTGSRSQAGLQPTMETSTVADFRARRRTNLKLRFEVFSVVTYPPFRLFLQKRTHAHESKRVDSKTLAKERIRSGEAT
jgi:hypothetical protein